ncbi:tail fiber domain-containing protein [bacterium]|nr:tail fiber domain-containing protein [bacterium]
MSNKMWFVLCLLLLSVTLCFAQIPRIISYQGYLTNTEDDPVPDGTYSLIFRLYNSETGGYTLWNETQDVEVTKGLYSVYLGSVTTLSIEFNQPYWLEIEFDGTTLTPRYQLGSSPYALNATNASTAGTAEEVAWSDITGTPSDISDGDDYMYGETASGDLSGTYPNPGVAKLQGVDLSSTAPTPGQVLKYDGSNWSPGTDLTGGASGTLNDLTDVSAASPAVGEVVKWNGSVWANAPDDAGGGSVGSLSEVLAVGNSAGINDINMNNNALLNIDWASSDDGAGSNLDADLLDAQDGSYYLNWHNFTGIPVDIFDGDDYMNGESAGGDLDGAYPDPTVGALQGVPVSSTVPGSGQVLKYDGANWAPAADETGGSSGIGGGGNQNYVAKFTNAAGDQIGDSHILDDDYVTVSTDIRIEHDGQVGLYYDGSAGYWSSIYVNAVNSTAKPGYGYLREGALYGHTFLDVDNTWIVKTANGSGLFERFAVDSGGNVGIGTMNPSYKLQVEGTVSTHGLYMSDGASAGYVLTSDGSGNGTWQPGGGGGTVSTTVRLTGDGSVGNPLDIAQQGAVAGQVLKWDGASWRPGNDEGGGGGDSDWIIDIDNMSSAVSGNVGIGTTTPSHKLTVESESDSATLRLIGPCGYYGIGAKLNFGDGDLAYIQEDDDDDLKISAFGRIALMAARVGIGTATPTAKLSVFGNTHINGRVGIGTDSPDVELTVQSNDLPEIQLKKTGGTNKTSKLRYFKDDDELFALGYDLWGTGDDLFSMYDVATGSGAVLNIKNGNVGIGTIDPWNKLEVHGDAEIENEYPALRFTGTETGSQNWMIQESEGSFKIRKWTVISWADHIVATSDAKLGICTNIPTRTLSVNGDAGGTGAWHNDSDLRLKKNISNIPNALDRVTQLRGVEFEWKDTGNHADGKQIGFIAQEVEPILPEVVDKPGEYYGMQYAPITALLVEAMKEQQEEIEQLRVEKETLEARLKAVEEQLHSN